MLLPFTPQYTHPFTFEELCELEVPIIAAEIPRLEHSVSRLKDSNHQIQSHVEGLTDPDDTEEAQEMNDVIQENEQTIKAQEERILLLKHALKAKMGFDPTNSHYGLTENRAIITEPTTASADNVPNSNISTSATPAQSMPLEGEATDDGMYL
ncbi:hypothetical protein QFC21_005437 [Naganishia friedmannii]|uniref:Uncharacterized protein n=1 Tax=Naganishia friedmannii TaxID=89922 RepID=A0ACC2VAT0_9TREE|nr:hypothetical protein QFC21_005437 [Naganishia friedmannii]